MKKMLSNYGHLTREIFIRTFEKNDATCLKCYKITMFKPLLVTLACFSTLLGSQVFAGNKDPKFITNKSIGPYPYYAAHISSKEEGENKLKLLNSGLAALQMRLDMIRRAKKEIILEYFIYERDLAGKILFHELIKKAKEGVRVRILLDKSITIIEMDEYYGKFLKEHGIELSHNNRAIDPSSAQFRTHRKLFAIDRKEAITGGRNIGDDYFDLDEVYNFYDRDVWIQGPIVQALWDSFDGFWKHSQIKKSKEPRATFRSRQIFRSNRARKRYEALRTPQHLRRLEEARSFINDMDGMDEKIKEIEKVSKPLLNLTKTHVCPKATYISDTPGANLKKRVMRSYRDKYKILRKELHRRLLTENETGDEVYLMSPYFMLNDQWQKDLNYLLDTGKKVHLYTNSLGSTDAFYVAANFYRIIFDWQKKGLIAYIHDSKFGGLTPAVNDAVKKARWGMHSKTMIFDNDSAYIGTYNIDNRSDFYNAEMGIFCDGSKEFVDELKENLQSRLQNAYTITGEKKAVDKDGNEADWLGNASDDTVRSMNLMKIPGRIFEFLM